MNKNKGKSIEEEFRSSQVYRTLSDSGSFVAEKVAMGLGKAAEGLDSAVHSVVSGTKRPPEGQPPVSGGVPPQYAAGQPEPHVYQAQPQGQPSQYQSPQGQSFQYQSPQGQPSAGQTPSYGQTAQPQGTYRYTAAPQNSGQAYPNSPGHPVAPPKMKMVRQGSTVKFYLTAVAALLYAFFLPMYEPWHFVAFGISLVGIFLLSSMLFKGKKTFVPIEEKAPAKEPEKKEEAKPSRTGNPEVDKIIDEGNQQLKKMKALNEAIPDESLSDCIDRMERASSDIFAYIAEHPGKASGIRKFMNYYLPTTLKLLSSYQRLSSQKVKGENVTSTLFNISGMMHTVATAFEKQLDSLFDDEAMDISADITVFEAMLKQEGFVEDKDGVSGTTKLS